MIVVADSGPLHYLVLLDCAELLHILYGQVLIPPAVVDELSHRNAPAKVTAWLANCPGWLKIEPVAPENVLGLPVELDLGERQAIALAEQTRAQLILIDEYAGRAEARQRGLRITGTLGVLRFAAERGLIDVPKVLDNLESTNFYLDEALIQSVFEKWLR